MKKSIIYILVAFSVFSCTTNKSDKPILSVSIEPQRFFLEQLVGDKYTINTVIPSGSNPETFDPSPAQMIAVSTSHLYFKLGFFGFEQTWLKDVEKNSSTIKVIDCSASIPVLENHQCDEHGHDHAHESHSHAGPDPHIWSSPRMASIIVDNMYKALVENDSDNEVFYKDNYNHLKTEILETDSIIKSYIDKSLSKSFVIYHPALSYYAEEYGLKQLSIEFEGKNPSPAQMKAVIDQARAENVKVVFIQTEFDQKNGETIAKELGAKLVSINLMDYNWQNEMIKIAKALAGEYE